MWGNVKTRRPQCAAYTLNRSQISQDSIDIPLVWSLHLRALRSELHSNILSGQVPYKKSTAINGPFQPALIGLRIQVQVNRHGPVVVLGELTHLKRPGMRSRLPVDVSRRFPRLIRTNPVKIAPKAPPPRLHLAAYLRQQPFEPWLRIDRRVHHYVALHDYGYSALRESEREAGGKSKAVRGMGAAALEIQIHRPLDQATGRDQRKVHRPRNGILSIAR